MLPWQHPMTMLGPAVALVTHFFAFPFVDLPVATDIRHYFYFAKLTTAGGTLDKDVFEFKTPLAALAGACLPCSQGSRSFASIT
jgi:hypothetical protein